MQRPLIQRIATIAASLALAYAAAPAVAAGTAAATAHPAFKVEVTGKGEPVILIPGLASSGEVWNGTVAHYCGSRQCHVVTLAGFAGVPAIEGPLLPAVEQQLSDYIAANKFDHPIVIGHSLGGFLGMKLAVDHPDQVGRLVIVDTLPALAAIQMPSITGAQMKEMAAGMRARMESMDAEAKRSNQMKTLHAMITKQEDIDRAAGWGKQSDPATVTNAMVEMMSEDLRPEVSRIKAPTLVLGSWIAYKDYGTKPMFEQLYKTQYQQLPNVKVELADNARHFIMYDDPAWMYDRIDNFLK
ncbi:alpha/beta fold hydrolase [Duganella violaceipulchra]|uniref:Alpha/beta hydrolase n=1 Tax=Duganella violaceipulchra TaxID=2849652 RepID=A0AA41KZ91_9BURK|nr:alpha/beta hydrolase [Duganella violaceicalia]MBV6319901.1 alpha/beta hydrolase [Duganella violaceicalia]MCP2010265.1 pimeloyl-ACP methyl ester carboxylesterase [Duganella violaceicalia]